MRYKIPISKPHLTTDDFNEIKKCFDSSWVSSKSPWVERFENEFAKKISKTKYAVAVNSGTSALFLSLKALEIGKNDEVILPTFTMIATINAVEWAGAIPVLVDSISETNWNMDPDEVKKKITRKTKAIIPVHIYGYMCQMERLNKIAKENNLFVIEDAAEAMGAELDGKRAGSFGDVGCFSLYVNKTITAGNGGMISTNSKKIASRLKQLRFFDFNEGEHFKHNIVGYNLVLSGMQGALGFSQVKRFDKLLAKRKEVFKWYKNGLKNLKIQYMNQMRNEAPSYWLPAILFESSKEKERIKKILESEGIETRDFFLPIHKQPVYRNIFDREEYNVVDSFWDRGLLLPSYFEINMRELELCISFFK